MFLFVHILFGAAIGSVIENVYLAVILALISHYLLDIVPHIDYPIKTDDRKKKRKVVYGGLKLATDLGLGVLSVIIFSNNQPAVYICSFAGMFPDLLTAFKYLTPSNKILEMHYNFHSIKMHFLKNSKVSRFWRIIMQAIVIIISVAILTKI